MNLTYGYQASAGQMGADSTAGNARQLMTISGTIGGLTESAAYSYDNLGRLVTSNQTSNGATAQRRFAYDRWGTAIRSPEMAFGPGIGGLDREVFDNLELCAGVIPVTPDA